MKQIQFLQLYLLKFLTSVFCVFSTFEPVSSVELVWAVLQNQPKTSGRYQTIQTLLN